MTNILDFLQSEDPEAILYVFGDHGPFVNRRLQEENSSKFFVQGGYGVFGGVYPRNRCTSSFAKPYTDGYTTISQGALMIIRCLSDGQEPVVNDIHYPVGIPDRIWGSKDKQKYNYEDYLYE